MHFVKQAKYIEGYKLAITFEDNITKLIDLDGHLDNGVFKLLKDISYFQTVRVDNDLDTIVWDNGADVSPDFLYEIGQNIEENKKVV